MLLLGDTIRASELQHLLNALRQLEAWNSLWWREEMVIREFIVSVAHLI